VALKMLFGDKAKYLGLVFGVAFATLLITQQSALFAGLMQRTSSFVTDVQEANLWVMDPVVSYLDNTRALRDTELARVRGVPGVAWAVPFLKAQGSIKTEDGGLNTGFVIGVDDTTMIGVPQRFVMGSRNDLRRPDTVCMDKAGYAFLWPGEPQIPGRVLELNDRRAVVSCLVEASAPFSTMPILYTRYAQALDYVPGGRNRMTFVLARTAEGLAPEAVAAEVTARTGLRAVTGGAFSWSTIQYYLENTGIPVNFGAVIILGVIVGVAIVGLTFNMFVSENMKQYAALKAIGVTNPRLIGMVLAQAGVVGFVGYAIGTGLGAAFFEFLTKGDSDLRGFYLPWQVSAGVALLVTAIMTIATFISLRRVLVVDPATVFRG
jgi:putative ABC transport system permease protein